MIGKARSNASLADVLVDNRVQRKDAVSVLHNAARPPVKAKESSAQVKI